MKTDKDNLSTYKNKLQDILSYFDQGLYSKREAEMAMYKAAYAQIENIEKNLEKLREEVRKNELFT